jgi:autotransporter-associated beta strand protein
MRFNANLRRHVCSAAVLMASAMAVSAAQAGLSITNGDLEQNSAQSTDITGWFNYVAPDNGPWWLSAWQGPVVSFNGSTIMGFSGDQALSPWSYQSIGVREAADTTKTLRFDLGMFTDAGETRDLGITVQVYQSDGTFVGADSSDIIGAAGVTLIDSISTTSGALTGGQSVRKTLDLNLASANTTGELFLRFSNFNGGTGAGDPWTQIDNIKFVSTPPRPNINFITYAGPAAGGTWDNYVTTHFTSAGTPIAFLDGDDVHFDNTGAVDGSGVSNVTVVGTVEPASVTIDSTHDYVFTGGSISGFGSTLTKRGSGKVTFNQGNTFSAGVSIEAGSVELTGINNGSSYGINGGAIVNNGTIILNRQYQNAADINEWNPLPLEQEVSGSGNIVIKNHAIIGERGQTTKNNTFTGTVTIESGFVYLGDVNGLGSTSTGTTVMSGATLAVVDEWHLGADAVIAEPLTLNGLGVASWFNGGNPAGALFQWEGNRTFSGSIHLGSTSSVIVRDDLGTTDVTTMAWTGPLTAAPGAGLQKEGDGTLAYTGGTLESLTVYAGKMKQTAGMTKVKTLYLEVGTSLDLTSSVLVVDYDGTATTYADLLAKIQTSTIFTSLDPNKYTVGILETATAPVTSIGGVSIDASSVVVRGTLLGDYDLNGAVSFSDLVLLAQNYNGSGKLYQQGDGNYSGTVDFADLVSLAQNYNQTVSGAQTAGLSSGFLADFALAQSLVPEPISLVLLLSAGGLVLGRRRQ